VGRLSGSNVKIKISPPTKVNVVTGQHLHEGRAVVKHLLYRAKTKAIALTVRLGLIKVSAVLAPVSIVGRS
jgi:hypothetical protein